MIFALMVVAAIAHLHEDEYNSLSFVPHIDDVVTEKQQIVDLRTDLLHFGESLVAAEKDFVDTTNLEREILILQHRRDELCEAVSSTYHSRSNAAHVIREKLNQNNQLAQQGGRHVNSFIKAAQANAIELHSLEEEFGFYVTASRACDAIFTALQRFEIRLNELKSTVEDGSEL